MTNIPYVTFMKHAQVVTKSSSDGRPVLKGVIHRPDHIAVTDSHRLYFLKGAFEDGEKLLNPKTGEAIEGNYPDISRLIPSGGELFTTELNVDDLQKALKLIEQAGKHGKASDIVDTSFENGELTFATDGNSIIQTSYTHKAESKADPFVFYASSKYLAEALTFIKDAGVTEVTFSFYGPQRPFTFTHGDLTVLLLPIRRTQGGR